MHATQNKNLKYQFHTFQEIPLKLHKKLQQITFHSENAELGQSNIIKKHSTQNKVVLISIINCKNTKGYECLVKT